MPSTPNRNAFILGSLAATMMAAMVAGTPVAADPDLSTVEGRFAHVTSKLDKNGVYYFYIDMEGMADLYANAAAEALESIRKHVEEPEVLEVMDMVAERGGALYNYLGISASRGYGSSSIPDGDGFLTRTFLSLDREKLGNNPLYAVREPSARRGLHIAPENTLVFASMDVSLRGGLDAVYEIAEIVLPEMGTMQLDQGFLMAQAFTTMPWKDVFQSLDGEMVVAAWADTDDWRTFEGDPGSELHYPHIEYIVALETSDSVLADGIINYAELQAFDVETTEAGDVLVSTLIPPDYLPAPRVSIARDETFTYFSSSAPTLVDAIARQQAQAGGLAESAALREAMTDFPLESNSLTFIDARIHEIVDAFNERNFDDSPQSAMTRELGKIGTLISRPQTEVSVSISQPDGILTMSRGANSPRNNLLIMPIAAAGMLTAVSVPGFLRAREISRRNACQENQAKLDGALLQFMLENRFNSRGEAIEQLDVTSQQYPADGSWVGVLIGEDHYIRFQPVCPSGGVYTFNDTDENPDLPPVSCSHTNLPDVQPVFWHVFPGTELP